MPIDKNGFEIKKGDAVLVDDPRPSDMWNHSFAGQVEEIKADGTVCVVDGDGDCWDMEADQIQVQEEEYECPDCGGTLHIAMIDDAVGHGLHEGKCCPGCGWED